MYLYTMKKLSLRKMMSALVRQDAIDQGARDGRFRQRVEPSKKKYNRAKTKRDFLSEQ